MSSSLEGRSALVTGGGRGIGKGIALALARAGARVAVNYLIEPDLADHTVTEIAAFGGEGLAVRGDVGSSLDATAMMATVVDRFDGLDILVNNAGVQSWSAFLDVTEADWDRVITTNLKGTFLCSQAAGRYMKDHGGGSIINIGSGCNKVPFPDLVAYTASKGGVEMLTKVAAIDLGRFGIRVNCIAPGAIEVERTRLEAPTYGSSWGRITPLGRVGTPEDVGKAVVYLAGDESSFVTGQTLWLDGGLFTQPRWAYDEAHEAVDR